MKTLSAITLLYFILHQPLFAQANFEDTYAIAAANNYSAIADKIVAARFDVDDLSLQQKYTRLKNLQLRITTITEKLPNDPMSWFLSGLNINNLAETRYLMVLEKSGQTQASADMEVSNYNIARSRAYANAIRLDSKPPHKLSSAIYATIGYGLSNSQKIKTYSREIELGSPSENESNEWFMHWAKIDVLVHEKKLDEAQAALDELKELLKKKNKSDSPYSSISQRAEQQVSTATQKSQQRKNKAKTAQAKAASDTSLDDTDQPWTWKKWLIFSIGVLTFVSVLVTAVLARNR